MEKGESSKRVGRGDLKEAVVVIRAFEEYRLMEVDLLIIPPYGSCLLPVHVSRNGVGVATLFSGSEPEVTECGSCSYVFEVTVSTSGSLFRLRKLFLLIRPSRITAAQLASYVDLFVCVKSHFAGLIDVACLYVLSPTSLVL